MEEKSNTEIWLKAEEVKELGLIDKIGIPEFVEKIELSYGVEE